jgi:hypothetical protein
LSNDDFQVLVVKPLKKHWAQPPIQSYSQEESVKGDAPSAVNEFERVEATTANAQEGVSSQVGPPFGVAFKIVLGVHLDRFR